MYVLQGCISWHICRDRFIMREWPCTASSRDLLTQRFSSTLMGNRKYLGRRGHTTQYIIPLDSVRIQYIPSLDSVCIQYAMYSVFLGNNPFLGQGQGIHWCRPNEPWKSESTRFVCSLLSNTFNIFPISTTFLKRWQLFLRKNAIFFKNSCNIFAMEVFWEF